MLGDGQNIRALAVSLLDSQDRGYKSGRLVVNRGVMKNPKDK
jgi:hypothetical protein